jgi:multidrug resistance efflux pump
MSLLRRSAARVLAGFLLTAGMAGAGVRYLDTSTPPPAEAPAPEAEAVVCSGHVDVKHGVASLYPLQPGRVAAVPVEEGQAVRDGDVLVRLDDRPSRLRVAEAEADLATARVHLEQAREVPRQHEARLGRLRASREAVRHRLAAARQSLAARRAYQRVDDIGKYQHDPVVSREIAGLEEQVRELEALLQVEEQNLAELEAHDPATDVHRAEEEVRAREARLGQARENLRECEVRAPSDGRVLRILVGPGDLLGTTPRQTVVLFCPDEPRLVRAEVEQEFAHRVAPGQPAEVRDDSRSGATWRGRVTSISDWYTQRRSVVQEPLELNDVRTIECIITLDPGQPAPRVGQRVRVRIGAGQ